MKSSDDSILKVKSDLIDGLLKIPTTAFRTRVHQFVRDLEKSHRYSINEKLHAVTKNLIEACNEVRDKQTRELTEDLQEARLDQIHELEKRLDGFRYKDQLKDHLSEILKKSADQEIKEHFHACNSTTAALVAEQQRACHEIFKFEAAKEELTKSVLAAIGSDNPASKIAAAFDVWDRGFDAMSRQMADKMKTLCADYQAKLITDKTGETDA